MDTTLHRIDPARNAFRFYRLALWPDLFGGVSLAREWGRLGQPGKLRLDPYEARRQIGEKAQHSVAVQTPGNNHLTVSINTVNLEHRFGEIYADDCGLHGDDLRIQRDGSLSGGFIHQMRGPSIPSRYTVQHLGQSTMINRLTTRQRVMDQLSLALDPRLGPSADELVNAWNIDPGLRAKAEAKRGRPAPGTFLDPMLAQGLVSLGVSIAGGLTTNLILDFIRVRLKAKGKENTPVEIEQRDLPTGERIFITRVGQGGSS